MATSAIVPHTRIDNSIIDTLPAQLGIYGLGIYVAIKRYLNTRTGDCYPSYQTLAKKLHIDRSTVIRYVKKMKELKVISPEWRFKEDGSHTSNQYDFQGAGNAVPSKIQGADISVPSIEIDEPVQIEQYGGSEPPALVAQNHHPGCTGPPKQSSSLNKKMRTITEVDLMPTEKQKTCTHPPDLTVILPDNITICNHCFGLLDEDFKLIEEGKTPAAEAA